MIKEKFEYTNKDGVKFEIVIETIPVHERSKRWIFLFKVTEKETRLSYPYKATVKKEVCQTEELAEVFIKGDPLRYLESVLLDSYKDGETEFVLPENFDPEWWVL